MDDLLKVVRDHLRRCGEIEELLRIDFVEQGSHGYGSSGGAGGSSLPGDPTWREVACKMREYCPPEWVELPSRSVVESLVRGDEKGAKITVWDGFSVHYPLDWLKVADQLKEFFTGPLEKLVLEEVFLNGRSVRSVVIGTEFSLSAAKMAEGIIGAFGVGVAKGMKMV